MKLCRHVEYLHGGKPKLCSEMIEDSEVCCKSTLNHLRHNVKLANALILPQLEEYVIPKQTKSRDIAGGSGSQRNRNNPLQINETAAEKYSKLKDEIEGLRGKNRTLQNANEISRLTEECFRLIDVREERVTLGICSCGHVLEENKGDHRKTVVCPRCRSIHDRVTLLEVAMNKLNQLLATAEEICDALETQDVFIGVKKIKVWVNHKRLFAKGINAEGQALYSMRECMELAKTIQGKARGDVRSTPEPTETICLTHGANCTKEQHAELYK